VVQRAAAAITNEDNNNKSPTKNTAAEEALLNVHRADLKREGGGTSRGSSKSIVLLELGRETVESWAKFAKKASI
jgi:hypothetical protein